MSSSVAKSLSVRPENESTEVYSITVDEPKRISLQKKGSRIKVKVRPPATDAAVAAVATDGDIPAIPNSYADRIAKAKKQRSIKKSSAPTAPRSPRAVPAADRGDPSLPTAADLEVTVNNVALKDRIVRPLTPNLIPSSPQYLSNRRQFIDYMNRVLLKLQDHLESFDKPAGDGFKTLLHQDIVKHYINAMTPYRGVLLYHGLGSGKTCSSIVIAEGLKSDKKIVVMMPASLRSNYIKELKYCGDVLYRQHQYWEFAPVTTAATAASLSRYLQLNVDYIKKHRGAWVFDMNRAPNFDSLSTQDQQSVDAQILAMIEAKYEFYNYNGLRHETVAKTMSKNMTVNPFDDCVLVIDEVHNMVGTIANQIETNASKSPRPLMLILYDFIRSAKNARMVFLSGTPIINYPNEMGILFNMIRGDVASYRFRLLDIGHSEASMRRAFDEVGVVDRVEYSKANNEVVITQNPYGFVTADSRRRGREGGRGRIPESHQGLHEEEEHPLHGRHG